MSLKKCNLNSVATLASALCILTSTSCGGGEIAPKLVKTTKRIRIESEGEARLKSAELGAVPAETVSNEAVQVRSAGPLKEAGDEPAPLREFLLPSQVSSSGSAVRQTSGGVPRKNHFFDLQNDTPAKSVKPPMRSAALAPPRRFRLGQVQKNPLVVDAPPQLRRFDVEERPLVLPETHANASIDDALVLQEQPLPPRVVEDLDQALDMLSADTDQRTAVRETVRGGGFGMLAIDHIGSHMPSTGNSDDARQNEPIQRYATDLVLPGAPEPEVDDREPLDTLRNHLDAFDGVGLIEETEEDRRGPQAEPDPKTAKSIAKALELFPTDSAEAEEAPAVRLGGPQENETIGSGVSIDAVIAKSEIKRPMEVDELIAASAKRVSSDQTVGAAKKQKKSGWMEKLASWPTKSKSGTTQSRDRQVSEPVRTENTQAYPRKRSGGILDQWLKRSK